MALNSSDLMRDAALDELALKNIDDAFEPIFVVGVQRKDFEVFLSHSIFETLPLKSNRVCISLLAWATAFSTSCKSSLETTSDMKILDGA